jgi:hypothetical protein
MGKGIAAMGHLPETSVTLVSGADNKSIQAIRSMINTLAIIQAGDQPALSAATILCNGNSPYMNSTWTLTSNVGATATYTLTSAIVGDIVTLNGLTYTGVSGTPSEGEFDIDTSDTAAATSLAAQITSDTRAGTLDVTLSATSAVGVVTVTAGKGNLTFNDGNDVTIASSDATIVASAAVLSGGVDFAPIWVSEVSNLSDGAKGRPALSTRRTIDLELDPTTDSSFNFTLRSLLSVIKFIESLEDKVAQTGVGSTGDATYTAIDLNGATPYETFNWTVTKLADLYTIVPTATS